MTLKGCALSFGKRYGNDLRVIFYQWPKLCIGLDVEANIQILKGIYCKTCIKCSKLIFVKIMITYLRKNQFENFKDIWNLSKAALLIIANSHSNKRSQITYKNASEWQFEFECGIKKLYKLQFLRRVGQSPFLHVSFVDTLITQLK